MNDVRVALSRLGHLLLMVERRMEELMEGFNVLVKFGRLRLRPWRRTKESPPYAVYWILLNPQLYERVPWKKKKPRFPFRRFKVRNRQELDDAIYHGMVSSYRKVVYRYHAWATALNSAHSLISRTIDGVRKQLAGFNPAAPPARFKSNHHRASVYLEGFIKGLEEAKTDLQRLAVQMRVYDYLPLRLEYEQDPDHPYGRLRWRWVRDGKPEAALTERHKRHLSLRWEDRNLLKPFELRRRKVTSRLGVFTKIVRRLRARIPPSVTRVLKLLGTEELFLSFELERLKVTA